MDPTATQAPVVGSTSLRATTSWRASTLLAATVIAALATVVFWALRTTALDEDGPGFVNTVALARGPFAYHHVGYLELGRLAANAVFAGAALPGLLLTSAVCGGLALALLVVVVGREGRRTDALLFGAAFAVAPALWFQSTRVELHSAQLFGGVLLLACASLATGRSRALQAAALVVGTLIAVPMHATNILLVPGAIWIAARRTRGTARIDRGALAAALVGAVLGGLGGSAINVLGRGAATPETVSDAQSLLVKFFAGPSLEMVWQELLLAWFPPLLVASIVLASTRRHWRAAMPFLLAALPAIVFFAIFGVPTSGGYFTSGVAALVLAAASTGAPQLSEPRHAPRSSAWLLLALLVLLGGYRSYVDTRNPSRVFLEDYSAKRFTRLKNVLPEGGWMLGIEPYRQSITGRDPRWTDVDLSDSLKSSIQNGVTPAAFAARYREVVQAVMHDRTTVVIDETWKLFATVEPGIEQLILAVIELFEEQYDFRSVEFDGVQYSIGEPRS